MPRGGASRKLDDWEPRIVWIFGSPRTGSTWLLNLLSVVPGTVRINEPAIGVHLAPLVSGILDLKPDDVHAETLRLNDFRDGGPDYFFATSFMSTWKPIVRQLILARVAAHVEARGTASGDPLVAIKEPHGSQGADVIMSVVPRSRLLFLLRDGRDVIDSELDSAKPGSWAMSRLEGFASPAGESRLAYIRDRAHAWLSRTNAVRRAYAAHDPKLRLMLRYEDLLGDTEGRLASVLDWLGRTVDRAQVASFAEKLSFGAIKPEDRGSGKFTRSAQPGLWREYLDADEQRVVNELLGPMLRELGYDD